MKKYDDYLSFKQNVEQALEVLSFIGRHQRTTAKDVGKIHSLNAKLEIHFQETDGAKNYHTNTVLDLYISKAIREIFWSEVVDKAREIMREDVRLKFNLCREELEVALKNINDTDT